ncbi:MAG: anti-sigma factor [Actinobacteria bacterium]|nr:MAG: anti-sigma factor [Actinomycetota bacterium]
MRVSCACRAPRACDRDADSPCNARFTRRTAALMTCEELVELVTDYLEGALSAADRARFEEHIELCVMCHDHMDRMRAIVGELGALHERHIDPEVLAEMQARFAGWHAGT